MIISSAIGCNFGFRRGRQDFTSIKVLKITAPGDANTFSLNTTLFLVFQIVHRAPAQMNKITFCFFPGQPSTMSEKSELQLVGEEGQARQLRRNDMRKLAMGH